MSKPKHPDWRGWTIRMKNWHAPLYVQAEMPPGHIAWTGDKNKAIGFRKKREAYEFIERLNENPDGCIVSFSPWRAAPQAPTP